jgi:hypothetical protein
MLRAMRRKLPPSVGRPKFNTKMVQPSGSTVEFFVNFTMSKEIKVWVSIVGICCYV